MSQGLGPAAAAKLEAAHQTLQEAVGSLPEAALAWKPADDVWSVLEILGHVAEFVPFWTAQTLRIARQPDLEWGRTHADTDRLAAVQRASSRTLAELLEEIRTGVAASAATLRGISDADLAVEAPSRNPRWGRKPASFIVDELLVGHVAKHAGQIRRNADQFATVR